MTTNAQLSSPSVGFLKSCSCSWSCTGNKYIWKKIDERTTRCSHRRRHSYLANRRLVTSVIKDSELGDVESLEPPADKVEIAVKQLDDLTTKYLSSICGDDFGLAVERTLLTLRKTLDIKDFDKIFDRKNPFIGEL
ncbi:hypothetical protein GpartN1_g1335.t1 [Galdieria partita]|uniref:Uncharacterized protein n=1 Tax=Galdieria partita TaxID=83374 RepID=A0A9C7PSN6_9RHOD|nr:hypothetical protein GpartN1_g1335.t1 [Galdieria partita]